MVKRTTLTLMLALAVFALPARAENPYPELAAEKSEKPAAAPATSSRTLFVVETDERSAVDSLNRVSGEIDRGFTYSSSDDTYKSDNHIGLSPFARQKQQDGSNTRYQ